MAGKSKDRPLFSENTGNEEAGFHSLYLHNDDINTFDYVIGSLVDVCNHSGIQAEQCAMIAHYKGRSEVKTGGQEELKEMQSGLASKGLISTIE